jgi:hypothetical protein
VGVLIVQHPDFWPMSAQKSVIVGRSPLPGRRSRSIGERASAVATTSEEDLKCHDLKQNASNR